MNFQPNEVFALQTSLEPNAKLLAGGSVHWPSVGQTDLCEAALVKLLLERNDAASQLRQQASKDHDGDSPLAVEVAPCSRNGRTSVRG